MSQKKLLLFIVIGMLCLPWSFLMAQDCPGDCPGDLNGDRRVDLADFAIFAQNWMNECPIPLRLPYFTVVQSGLTEEQAERLGGALGIKGLLFEDGVAQFVDPSGFQKVPTTPVTNRELIALLLKDTENDDGELVFEAFDFDAIAKIKPMPGKTAYSLFRNALAETDLLPENAVPEITHTVFEAFDVRGRPVVENAILDTGVYHEFHLNDIPLIGPGANIRVAFGPEGEVTHLQYANRMVKEGESLPIIPLEEMGSKIANAFGGFINFRPEIRLVYYAPPLKLNTVQTILPFYEVGGSFLGHDGNPVHLLTKLVPAINDPQFVPQVNLIMEAEGGAIFARAEVEGGLEPYTFSWTSSNADLSQYSDDIIQYALEPRQPIKQETLHVLVTDGNGVPVHAVKTIPVTVTPGPAGGNITPLIGGVRDYGVERAVSDLGGPEQSSYLNYMSGNGNLRFNWTGDNSWERDFKEGDTGLDIYYIDNADETLYIGHGNGGAFYFTSSHDDTSIAYADVVKAWGNKDLEWLALLSCQVLRDSYGGKKWYQRWGPTFDGLHLLLGYQTNAAAETTTPGVFAQYQMGKHYFFGTITLPVRAAWFIAKALQQPSDREAVAMGVFGIDGVLSGYNDYFWGKGPVGPDIRGSNIYGYWRLVYK